MLGQSPVQLALVLPVSFWRVPSSPAHLSPRVNVARHYFLSLNGLPQSSQEVVVLSEPLGDSSFVGTKSNQ